MRTKVKLSIRTLVYIIIIAAVITGAAGIEDQNIKNIYAENAENKDTVSNIEQIADGIILWKTESLGVQNIHDLVNGKFSEYAGQGDTEWYVTALAGYKEKGIFENSNYIESLINYYKEEEVRNAVSRQKIALVLSHAGTESDMVTEIIDNSIGELGVMSYIYGLILMNSGDYKSSMDTDDIIETIISMKIQGGGWALTGTVPDIDVTAMAVQALAPYYEREDVNFVIEEALNILSQRQLDTGDYSSWGVRNSESGAQVIIALSCLRIDLLKDARFIKNHNTLLDGLMYYKTQDGGFAHTINGNVNDTATAQALCALVSMWRLYTEKSSLYDFKNDTEVNVNDDIVETQDTGVKISNTPPINEINQNGKTHYKIIGIIAAISAAVIILCVFLLVFFRRRKIY